MESSHLRDKLNEHLTALLSWPVGWNGYDVLSPNPAAVQRAQSLVPLICVDPFPNVTADAEGNVVLEWWSGVYHAALYIEPETVDLVLSTSTSILTP